MLSTLYIMWHIHLQGLRLLLPTVKEEKHLQENTLFEIDLDLDVAQYPLHHVTYSPANFEFATSNGLKKNAGITKVLLLNAGQ